MEGNSGFIAPKEFKLANKLEVVYQYVPNVKLASINCFIKTGSVNEGEENSGISHFLEHMLFNGTKNFGSGEIDEFIDSKGGSNNAYTSNDLTSYYVNIPSQEAEAGFFVISDMVFNALLDDDEVIKERPAVLQEMKRQFDNPIYEMVRDYHASLYKGTPYEKEIIGTEETVNSFNSQNLKEYYNKFYHPENMVLMITGDLSFEYVEELANKYFNQHRDVEKGQCYDSKIITEIKEREIKEFKADVGTDYALLSFPLPDYAASQIHAIEMLDNILSSGEYSILNEVLKNEKGVVISVDSLTDFNKYNGAFAIFGIVEHGRAEEFRSQTMNILQEIASGIFDEKRLERAKNRIRSFQIFEREHIYSLGDEIGQAYSLGFKEYYLNYSKIIEGITKDDIVQAAAYLLSKNAYFAITSK